MRSTCRRLTDQMRSRSTFIRIGIAWQPRRAMLMVSNMTMMRLGSDFRLLPKYGGRDWNLEKAERGEAVSVRLYS